MYFRIYYSVSENIADAINEQVSFISSVVQMTQFWNQVLERKQQQKGHGIPSYWHSDLENYSMKALDDL